MKNVFREYVERYKKYPFKLYKDGKEADFLLLEAEHEQFMEYMDLVSEVMTEITWLKLVYGIEICLNYDLIHNMNDLKEVLEDLEEVKKKYINR